MRRPTVITGPRARLLVIGAAAAIGACASHGAPHPPTANVPASVQTVFVDDFGGGLFARELRDEIGDALELSARFHVIGDPVVADAILSGTFRVVSPNRPAAAPPLAPAGTVQILLRESGRVVWQYSYRDTRTGTELAPPTELQQVRGIARQFVAQLLSVSTARQ